MTWTQDAKFSSCNNCAGSNGAVWTTAKRFLNLQTDLKHQKMYQCYFCLFSAMFSMLPRKTRRDSMDYDICLQTPRLCWWHLFALSKGYRRWFEKRGMSSRVLPMGAPLSLKSAKPSWTFVCDLSLGYTGLIQFRTAKLLHTTRADHKPKVAMERWHIKEGSQLHCWLRHTIHSPKITMEWVAPGVHGTKR